MEQVQFAVSAKTARLIGRENISDVDGAVIELIKNAYDADAECACVLFDMPFPSVPKRMPVELATDALDQKGLAELLRFYDHKDKFLEKKDGLVAHEEADLQAFLFSHNTITIIDNGCGMDEDTLKNAWMNIGTNDKEERRVSPKGRVKTGAKGIGRFALDKLSTETTVYTKSESDCLKKWQMNWNQFDTALMLDEVHAVLQDVDSTFESRVEKLINGRIKSYSSYKWDTGTIIVLTPTREIWSEAFFKKVNTNLRSIFPGENGSQFDVYVDNKYYSKCNFENERFHLGAGDYDYKIAIAFDGSDNLNVKISRNEIDTRRIKIQMPIAGKIYDLMLHDFWQREKFQSEKHIRSDYAKTVQYNLSATQTTKIDAGIIEAVGPFEADFYFLKNTPSKLEIVKPISKERRNILQKYSGIKLYRDGFKVRPYGEEGQGFDWLNLAERATKSPAGVSHESGSWRVRTNQLIGAVRITKDGNPNLYDMANREGLANNDAYRTFVSILEKAIETFEADRQYVFREYAQWFKEKESEFSSTADIIKDAKKHENIIDENPIAVPGETEYTKAQYEKAVRDLDEERRRQTEANKTMMLFSSAGVMTNTFSHEISRIMTDAGSRMQHVRAAVEIAFGEDGYTGDPDFDPFPIIKQAEETDLLLEDWLQVIMAGVNEHSFEKHKINMLEAINKIVALWQPLLSKKLITISPVQTDLLSQDMEYSIAEIDMNIILNNFMLNSAWFLERAVSTNRRIDISILEEQNSVVMALENNGPPLDSMFAHNPDKIFEAGVTSKKKEKKEGTGLGLWIVKTIVTDNLGQVSIMDKKDGFGLRITLPK